MQGWTRNGCAVPSDRDSCEQAGGWNLLTAAKTCQCSTAQVVPRLFNRATTAHQGTKVQRETTLQAPSESNRHCLCLQVSRGLVRPGLIILSRRVARQPTATALPPVEVQSLQYYSKKDHGEMIAIQQARCPKAWTARRREHCVTVALSLNQLCYRCQRCVLPWY